MRSRDVVRVSRHTHTGQFANNVCAARQSVVERLEYEASRSLADNETVATGRERPTGVYGIIIARRECVHSIKATHACRPDARLSAARNDHVCFA